MREGLLAADLRNLLTRVVAFEDLIYVYFVDFLQDGQFPIVGSEDSPEAMQLIEELGPVAEIINAVCIEDDH